MTMRNVVGILLVALAWVGCGEKKVRPLQEPAVPAPAAVATPSPTVTAPAVVVAAPQVQGDEADSPLRVIERYTAELREMVGLNERKQKGIKEEEKEKRVQGKVREFFDFPTLARLSLGPRWKRITPAQQKEYSQLFVELVENSYIRRSRDLVGNYELTFTGEKIAGENSKVTCRVARNDADIDILYELHRKDGKWMIFNIVLDNVDLVQNYQSQFHQIITKRGWNALIRLMQKKLDGGEEDEANL
jgi:phospholipid transport system substrate-binding protein